MSATERMASETPERNESTSKDPARTGQFRPFNPTPSSATTDWDEPQEERPERTRHIVDRFDGAAGLLLLRVAVAVILGIRGLQKIQHIDLLRQQLTELALPSPDVLAIVIAYGQFAIALALLLGVAVRVAGLGVAALAIGALVVGPWRSGDFFTAGQPGFNGELKFLLAGVGLALLGLGGGGWTVDRRFRRR